MYFYYTIESLSFLILSNLILFVTSVKSINEKLHVTLTNIFLTTSTYIVVVRNWNYIYYYYYYFIFFLKKVVNNRSGEAKCPTLHPTKTPTPWSLQTLNTLPPCSCYFSSPAPSQFIDTAFPLSQCTTTSRRPSLNLTTTLSCVRSEIYFSYLGYSLMTR